MIIACSVCGSPHALLRYCVQALLLYVLNRIDYTIPSFGQFAPL